jgi:hypothetical protein
MIVLWPWSGAMLPKHNAESLFQEIATMRENPQEQAFVDCQTYPETNYFPWNVLSTLEADGKFYNSELGIVQRYMAKMDPTEQQLLSHLPRNTRYVSYDPQSPTQEVIKLFATSGIRTVEDPLLSGFTVYRLPHVPGASP